jgi:hypothetical protein
MRSFNWLWLALLAFPLTLAAQELPQAPLQIRGTVISADGTPASGAIVWTAKFTHSPLVRHETVADGAGRFELNVDPGSWHVWARLGTQGGEGPARYETVEVSAGRSPEPVTIRLEDRGTFRGRLLEAESGKPIGGGRMYLDTGLVLTSDSNGNFEVGGLPRDNHESFVVAAGRMRMRVLFDTTAQFDTELEIPVPRSGKIIGRVVDAQGKPIPNSFVGRSTSGSYFSLNGLYQACNDDGRFEYDDAVPPDQSTRLTAGAPEFQSQDLDDLIVPADGTPLEVEFRLTPKPGGQGLAAADEPKQRVVSGVVSDPDRKPLAGVLVRWGYQPTRGAIESRTDGEGRFQLTVPDKEEMLAVLPANYLPEFPAVKAGGDQVVKITLRHGAFALGRVVDDQGTPLRDVRVVAVTRSPDPRIGNQFWLTESDIRTDANGRFLIVGVPEGARFDFLKPDLSDKRGQILELGGSENVVTLLHGGAVKGRVLDVNGEPIRNFRVLVGFPRERREGDKLDGFFAGYSGIGVRFTSADGAFVLTGVGADSVYRIEVLAEGHGEAVLDRVNAVPVNRLSSTEPATLQAAAARSLRVQARTKAGEQVPGARVTLVNGEVELDNTFQWGYHDASWEAMERKRTSSDGWADFPSLSFKEATVLVQAPGYGRRRVGWRKGEQEVVVELEPEAVIAGVIRDSNGSALQNAYVRAEFRGDHVSATIQPDSRGRFTISELPAGTWSVTVRGGDGISSVHDDKLSVKPGETKELTIQLK